MTVHPKPLASAQIRPTRSIILPTTPGRNVRFQQGVATVNNSDDLPFLLRRKDIKLMVTPYAMSWMEGILGKVDKVNAEVHWPDGYEVDAAGNITVPHEPELEPEITYPEMEEQITRAVKARPRKSTWQKPPSG